MILEQIKNPDFFNNSEQNMIYFLQNNLNSFDQVTLNKMAKESFLRLLLFYVFAKIRI